ncbi:excinuclease [Azoarcus taiwanensis]|uniref:Excinuclease n=1 Tax=Azoarcus taiwanensis TaxID=666964 RepID=A0A972F860_9RHOO|nr:excinuclease [Azoarcus taiwanensis]NMG03746.1 excinuclease [Azoarcus taiwanensis]
MKKKSLVVLAVLLAVSFNASARDDRKMLSVQDALASAAAEGKIGSDVRLFWGNQNHPTVSNRIGEWGTNKKTNALNKSDQEACNWVFLSAVIALQERARREGGNAIVNIRSNYKNNETSSETEFMCGVGNIIAGVALKGTVVKLAN